MLFERNRQSSGLIRLGKIKRNQHYKFKSLYSRRTSIFIIIDVHFKNKNNKILDQMRYFKIDCKFNELVVLGDKTEF